MQLHFKASGQGRAVVLLHGLFGSADNWQPIARQLAERFRVFAVDQRNHGHSPHAADMDYPLMAGDVNAFIAERGLESALVVGHSMGGKTAMQLALQFPGRVEKLVIVDMAPRAYAPALEPVFAALLALELAGFQTRQQIEDALAAEIPDLVLRLFLLKNLGRNPDGQFIWKMNLRGVADNYPRLGEPVGTAAPFAKPTLFIRGGKSNYLRAEDEPLIGELFPRAQFQTLVDADHWIHADAPEAFLARLLDFL